MFGIQRRAHAEHRDQRTAAQFVGRAQVLEQLGGDLGGAPLVHIRDADRERVQPAAAHDAAQRPGDQAQALRDQRQQGLVLARAQHGADLGVLLETHQEKAPRRAWPSAWTSQARAAAVPLAKDPGRLVARQAMAQHALPPHEKQTYRRKCARERQAQCEQVTLTHGAPYLETLGVAVRS